MKAFEDDAGYVYSGHTSGAIQPTEAEWLLKQMAIAESKQRLTERDKIIKVNATAKLVSIAEEPTREGFRVDPNDVMPPPMSASDILRTIAIADHYAPKPFPPNALTEHLDLVKERLASRCAREAEGSCWWWIKKVDKDGYGWIKVNLKKYAAHRLSYILYRGPVPTDALVCHKCDNRRCVNPEHLYLGSYSDNIKDAYARERRLSPQQYMLRLSGRIEGGGDE